MRYSVLVGNVGTVHRTHSYRVALQVYADYCRISEQGIGRAAGEPVTLMDGEDIAQEYTPVGED